MSAKLKFDGKSKYNFIYVRDDSLARENNLIKIGQTTMYEPVAGFHELSYEDAVDALLEHGFTYEDGVYELNDENKVKEILESGRYSGERASQAAADFRGYRLFLAVDNNGEAFTDKNLHKELSVWQNPKYAEKEREWFSLSLTEADRAIKNFIRNEPVDITMTKFTQKIEFEHLTQPQKEGASFVKHIIETNNQGLLDCVMRYGKTAAALHGVKQAFESSYQLKKVLVISHITNVAAGWLEDSLKVFGTQNAVLFSQQAIPSNLVGRGYPIYDSLSKALEIADRQGKTLIAFNSIQQGKFEAEKKSQNESALLDTHWDVVLVDEAHRGTRTSRVETLINKLNFDAKIEISGTPFNIGSDYSRDRVYSFNYFQELEFKAQLKCCAQESLTPAEQRMLELPDVAFHVLGYKPKEFLKDTPNGNIADIFRLLKYSSEDEARIDEKTNEIKSSRQYKKLLESSQEQANLYLLKEVNDWVEQKKIKPIDFIYRKDVEDFLKFMMESDTNMTVPFRFENIYDKDGHNIFKHTLWFLPSAAAVVALKKVMEELTVMGPRGPMKLFGEFNIFGAAYNEYKQYKVGGKSQYASDTEAALDFHKKAKPSITLSYQKLGVGSTLPKLGAVIMLSTSEEAKNYLQQTFRAKTPYYDQETGYRKTKAYVFDINKDRLYDIVGALSAWAPGKTVDSRISNTLKLLGIKEGKLELINNKLEYVFTEVSYEEVAGVIHKKFEESLARGSYNLDLSSVTISVVDKLVSTSSSGSRSSGPSTIVPPGSGPFRNPPVSTKPPQEDASEKASTSKNDTTLKEWVTDCFNLMKFMLFASQIEIDNILNADGSLKEDSYKNELCNVPASHLVDWFGKSGRNFFEEVLFKIPNHELYVIAWAKALRSLKNAGSELELTEAIMEFFDELAHIKIESNFVITPIKVAALLADNIELSEFTEASRVIDTGCKEAMPLLELYRRVLIRRPEIAETFALNIYSIPVNAKANSILKAVYNLLKWDKDNIIWLEDQFSSLFGLSETAREELRHNNAYLVTLRLQDKISSKLNKSLTDGDLAKIDEAICKKFSSIYDLEDNEIMEVQKLIKAFKDELPKFDVVVGNPPYQIETGGKSHQVYPEFYITATRLGKKVSMIFPRGWQVSTGKASGSSEHLSMRKDSRLKIVNNYFEDASSPVILFPDAGTSGVSIVLWDDEHYSNTVNYYEYGEFLDHKDMANVSYWGEDTNEIFNKIQSFITANTIKTMRDSVSGRGPYGVDNSIWTTNDKEESKFITLNSSDSSYIFLGQAKKSKPEKKNILKENPSIRTKNIALTGDKWKIVWTTFAGAAVYRKYSLLEPGELCTNQFLGLFFDTELERTNFESYFTTLFYRFVLSERMPTYNPYREFHEFAPDLSTVTNPRTGLVGWNSDWTDEDLKILFKDVLTDEDWAYIEKTAIESDPAGLKK